MSDRTNVSYADAGVHLDALDAMKKRIGQAVASTHGPRVLSRHGAFGGLFHITGLEEEDPVLVGSVDGVGTKVKVAQAYRKLDGLGLDIVNHCIDDILVCGARPLFFMDYLASSRMAAELLEAVVTSIAKACREAGVALLAGETAEMPGVYCEGEFDVVGCIVGVVSRDRIIDGSKIRPGNTLIGLPSTGLHTNGYSLARKVLVDAPGRQLSDPVPGSNQDAGQALLESHRSYLPEVKAWRENHINILGLAHITGGGYEGNICRILPDGCRAVVDVSTWTPLPIFQLIQSAGPVDPAEMYRVFNMGMGMIAVMSDDDAKRALTIVPVAVEIGRIVAGAGVELINLPSA